MVTGEDENLVLTAFDGAAGLVVIFFGVFLHVEIVLDQVEQGIRLEDVLPQVGRLVAVGVDRVFRVLVKRQEPGFVFLKPGGHEDLFVADRKMHQAPLELEQGLSGVPVLLVLFDGIFHKLAGDGIFKLGGDDGNAV